MIIPFNKPLIAKSQYKYLRKAINLKKWSGDGEFTLACQKLLQDNYNFRKVLLTTSCTDALELASILIETCPGDEIIVPSFTFVSTVNPFLLRGAKIIFADSQNNHPNININKIESLITKKTKAIVAVHYGGVSCDMEALLKITKKYGLYLIEDAAQAIDSYYLDKPLGGIGHLGVISFHDTKNIGCGEGGALIINDQKFITRAEILREKGTNRSAFFRGEIDKYGWVDIGSSFLPSDLLASILLSQLETVGKVTKKRKLIWGRYNSNLIKVKKILSDLIQLPIISQKENHNAHIYYVVCKNMAIRTQLINFMKAQDVSLAFHYQSLSESEYAKKNGLFKKLDYSKKFSDCLVRLPLYYDLKLSEVDHICKLLIAFIKTLKK